jgi:histidinol-phosphate aminotransferase
MEIRTGLSRRGFVGGVAATLGALTFKPGRDLWAEAVSQGINPYQQQDPEARYDAMAKLANNENPYGPPTSVLKAMDHAMKYANRYGYPDGGIMQAIADHHGVKRENIIMSSGSGELLTVVTAAFLEGGKKVVGAEPTYNSVYAYASQIKSQSIKVPLLKDYRQDIPGIIEATNRNKADVGLVYIVTPNNPTGVVVTAKEIKQVLDNIPRDIPVLIDEAYHHFVDDPEYATSVPYVLEGRQVIVLRTFSKIVGLAGMRLGYGVAPTNLIDKMGVKQTGTINAVVKHGGVAALKDTDAQATVKKINRELRNKTVAELEAMGYDCLPSECNFFMVGMKREVRPVIQEFEKRGVLVGRPFPPMTQHLRVSVGTADEMKRFMVAWKEIFPAATQNGSKSGS